MYETITRKLNTLLEEVKGGNLDRVVRRTYKNLFKLYYSFGFNKPRETSVLDKDWDVLIVLDACRYDTFKKYNKIKGKLNSIASMGSCTKEWLKKNFEKKILKDIIYVSANPYTEKQINASKIFYDVSNVFIHDWNEEYGTVLPEKVTQESIRMRRKYPNKKMIIHYIQPHVPYIGKKKLYSSKKLSEGNAWCKSLMNLLRYKNFNENYFYKLYIDNLKAVLSSVKKLLPYFNGKVIITADHGELFGEFNLYGHPPGIKIKSQIKVPWFEVDTDYYKKGGIESLDIDGEESGEVEEKEGEIKDKLRQLGYLD